MTDLGTFNAMTMSEATAVNSTGDVVGGSNSDAFLVHNGKMTNLGPGEATGINGFGEIVGNSQGAFLISGGKRTTLPRPLQLRGRRLQRRERDQRQPPDRGQLR